MRGNSIHRFSNTSVLSACAIDAPRVVTSDEMDDRLADVYARVGLRPGMMQRLAGIRERRWWNPGTSFSDGATMAGAKAMAEAGVDPSPNGLMVKTSRSPGEPGPSTAGGLPPPPGPPSSWPNISVAKGNPGVV